MEKNKVRQILNLKTGDIAENHTVEETNNEKEDKKRFFAGLSLASDLGFAVAIPIVGGALLGSYLDQKLGTLPKVTLSLVFLGLIISIFNIYTIVKKNT